MRTKTLDCGKQQYIYKSSLLYLGCKRLFDICSSLIGIIMLSPVFIVIAIWIKLEDPKGKIFFGHNRIGKDLKEFRCWKFRTMVHNAQELIKQFTPEQKEEFAKTFKLKDDPRITRIGHFLRKTSLDELPQLWNILVGEMSVVGPRPIVEDELKLYGIHADVFNKTRPGLTGLWQVSGRSETTYEERVAMDVEYIQTQTMILDLKIFFLTFIRVLRRNGAY